jgi:hypothetical protein
VDWLTRATGATDPGLYWSRWPQHFDYLYVLFTKPGGASPDAAHLALAVDGPGFQLYRVNKKR